MAERHHFGCAETENIATAPRCARAGLSTCKTRKKNSRPAGLLLFFGADYGARTRHLDLGKVALYQMS